MNIFKLTVDDVRHYPLDKQIYMDMTCKESPYYELGNDGKMRHYAVCPACNNPIQIIGMSGGENVEQIYARHTPKSIQNMAPYRRSAYENCPLAAQNRIQVEKTARKVGDHDVSEKILAILRDNFDRVILILEKSLGIRISKALAESLLDDYIAEDGHRYKYASLVNIPWMLVYMSMSKSLVGRTIIDENIQKAILDNASNAEFVENKLMRKGKNFLAVNMFCSGHVFQPKGNTVEESMTLKINFRTDNTTNIIHTKRIVFNYEDFQYYLGIPEGKGYRNQALLDLAKNKLN